MSSSFSNYFTIFLPFSVNLKLYHPCHQQFSCILWYKENLPPTEPATGSFSGCMATGSFYCILWYKEGQYRKSLHCPLIHFYFAKYLSRPCEYSITFWSISLALSELALLLSEIFEASELLAVISSLVADN